MATQTATKTRNAETSPRSGTQVIESKADANPVNPETAQPACKIKVEDSVTHVLATCQALRSQALEFVVSGAVCLIVALMQGQKINDDKDSVYVKLQSLVAEKGVKRSMAYGLLAAAKTLAMRITSTGTNALKDAVAIRGMIQSSDSAIEAVAQVGLALKNDHGIESYNGLVNMLNPKGIWTPEKAKAEAFARTPAGKAKASQKRTRAANSNAVKRLADHPSLLKTTLHTIAGSNPTGALDAILRGIDRLDDVTMLQNIRNACDKRIASLNTRKGASTGAAAEAQKEAA